MHRLRARGRYGQPAPAAAFPYRQMFVLGLCRISEPIAFMSIFPYIYYMIESFRITDNDKQIALYAGLVTSAFALAECISGPFWGRLSDRYGRKPILLMGLAGTGISMLVFGFARNLPTVLIARALGGLLNGNIGVIQTTVAEVITNEAHQARAYATMPFVWCLGSILGSALGGALADPVRNYPTLFSAGTIFERYPYLFTNLVCACMVLISMTIGILFLEETHEDRRSRRDVGLQMGRWLLCKCTRAASCTTSTKGDYASETMSLVDDDDDEQPPDYSSTAASPTLRPRPDTPSDLPPAYQSVEGSPRNSHSLLRCEPSPMDLSADLDEALQHTSDKRACGVANAFSRQVVLNILGFGILAYHTISAEQLLPVLFSMPETNTPPSMPFGFTGGFALSTKTIGGILATQGFIQMFVTLIVFPLVSRRLGTLSTYRLAVLSYPLLYIVVPYLTLVPTGWRTPAIFAVIVWKVTAQAFAFPSSSIMLANLAPSRKVLGTLNGVAASSASGSRAFGPTVSGLLQAAGLTVGAVGLPWWTNALIACSGATISIFMIESKARVCASEKQRAASEAQTAAESNNIDDVEPDAVLVAAEGLNSSDSLLQSSGSPLLTRLSLDTRRHAGSSRLS